LYAGIPTAKLLFAILRFARMLGYRGAA
jgi:hypothetical protein